MDSAAGLIARQLVLVQIWKWSQFNTASYRGQKKGSYRTPSQLAWRGQCCPPSTQDTSIFRQNATRFPILGQVLQLQAQHDTSSGRNIFVDSN